ncbi:hypothetical protein SB48_HM08orf05040 [Heyndrickxia coagulans]|uniref:Uncharacterized protein n=1 Tax=Heyndrickxia coagulans TaxID=1398 RepID=A0AAN0T8U7_HEYCO|nr:hypothetical protein SB48_HM08orf05040 [Heyndrickxia coagulans]
MHGWVITNAIFQITFFLYVNHYPSSVAFISIHFASWASRAGGVTIRNIRSLESMLYLLTIIFNITKWYESFNQNSLHTGILREKTQQEAS